MKNFITQAVAAIGYFICLWLPDGTEKQLLLDACFEVYRSTLEDSDGGLTTRPEVQP